MLIRWKRSLALSLGLLVSQAQADEQSWGRPATPANPAVPAVRLGRPIVAGQAPSAPKPAAPQPSASLARPVPLGPWTGAAAGAMLDQQFRPIAFSNGSGHEPDHSSRQRRWGAPAGNDGRGQERLEPVAAALAPYR